VASKAQGETMKMMEFQVEFSIPVSEPRLEIQKHTTEDYAATNQDQLIQVVIISLPTIEWQHMTAIHL
jgi:hypothetical protein